MRKILISENELRNIIREEFKALLLEMPLPRRKWKQKIENLLEQIIQNWCLVHYCTLVGRETLKKHWKEDELQTYLMKSASYNIDGNNTIPARTKALSEIWKERDFSTNVNSIDLIINTKFRKENIDVTTPEYTKCIEDCVSQSHNIISVIAKADRDNIIVYTDSI